MVTLPQATDSHLALFLKAHNVVNDKQYQTAQAEDKAKKNGIVASLITAKATDEDAIAAELAKKKKCQTIKLQNIMLASRPLKERYTDHFVLRNRIIPLKLDGNKLTVVIADSKALEEIKMVEGYTLNVIVTTLTAAENYFSTLNVTDFDKNQGWDGIERRDGEERGAGDDVPSPMEAFAKALSEEEGGKKGEVEFTGSSTVIDFVDNVLQNAIMLGVSDIHFEVYQETARLRYRCDGVLKEIEEYRDFLVENYAPIIARVKILAMLDISERRLPQDGGISFPYNDDTVDIRVSILPTSFGERVVMRVMNKESLTMPLEDLGFPPDESAKVEKAIAAPQGMILVTGPTGSGKSTTLYAILNQLNRGTVNILTAEDPVEFNVDGIGQVAVKESIGLNFSSALRSFLRQDPEIIMVGEIRDKETGDISVKAALTGHLVLSTLHTNDAPSTVTRLLNMGIPPYLLTSSLSLVIAQRLARVNCPECRVDDKDCSKDQLVALGFTEAEAAEIKPKIGKGCEHCLSTGIKGRRAVHEVLAISKDIKEVILHDGSDVQIKEVAKKEGFRSMQEIGRDLIAKGDISVAEYQRILVTED